MRKLSWVLVIVGLGMVAGWAQPVAPHGSPAILIDGSSTVAPILEAVAAEFAAVWADARIAVGVSGTSGGFRRFLARETDISNASRPIRGGEITGANAAGIEYIELLIGLDGIVVAIARQSKIFRPGVAPVLTLGELELLWSREAEGFITRWSQLGTRFTDAPITLSGGSSASGTFDLWTAQVNRTLGDIRADYFGTEEDQLLAEQTGADPYALTWFGFAFLEHNRDIVQAVAVDNRRVLIDTPSDVVTEINRRRVANNKEPLEVVGGTAEGIFPTVDTIGAFLYQPLSRPLFVYVNRESARRPMVAAFVDFLLRDDIIGSEEFMLDVGYLPAYATLLEATRAVWANRKVGTAFGGEFAGLPADEIIARYRAHAGL